MYLDYLIIGSGPSGLLVHKELSKFQNGIVVDSGNHDYLIKNCNEYQSLYQKQLK